MTDHLSASMLSALADGELSAEQLSAASEHLEGCASCTTSALHQSLLKAATAKAGVRYAPSPQFQEHLTQMVAEGFSASEPLDASSGTSPWRPGRRVGLLGWATAAVLLLASLSTMLVQRIRQRSEIGSEVVSAERSAFVTEIFDRHLAMLAGSLPPEVLSTDRHTVKPWFQGKTPFSFNLPESLPNNTTLDGANLTYLQNQPAAQLLFSIGKHRVSVFVAQKAGAAGSDEFDADHSGFHVLGRTAGDIQIVAVSDVDPARLADLVDAVELAQKTDPKESR